MEELQQAIIQADGRIRCPFDWCGKVNGVVSDGTIIKNYIVRCRASRRGREHFFVVNWNSEEKGEAKND